MQQHISTEEAAWQSVRVADNDIDVEYIYKHLEGN